MPTSRVGSSSFAVRSALRMYLRWPAPGREAFSLPMLQTATDGWLTVA